MRFKYYLRGAGIGVIVATLVLSIAFLFHDDISDEEVIRRAMKLGMVMQENNSGTLSDISPSGTSKADLETGADPQGGTKADEDPLGQADPASTGTDPSGSDAQTGQDGQTPDAPDDSQTSADDPSAGQDSQPSKTDNDNDPSSGNNSDNKPSGNNDDKPSGDKQDDTKNTDQKDSKNKNDNKDDQPSQREPDNQEETPDEVKIVIESGDVSRKVSTKVFEAGLVDDAAEFNAFLGANDYDNMLQPGTYQIKKGSSFQEIARILTRQ